MQIELTPYGRYLYSIGKFKPHSYKDLPVRIAEFGTVYRYEQSGELHGMTRVRGFTQDDAHIFCSIDQVGDEVLGVIDLILKVFKSLSFKDYKVQISLRDENDSSKYIGESTLWDRAENDLIEAVKRKKIQQFKKTKRKRTKFLITIMTYMQD